ncbi:MAG: hypothetical protein ACM3UL_05175, partial [Ignavibacteria bacterium]
TYDQRIWAIGRGPSKTTVTAGPNVGSDAVVIQGLVTDISPGTQEFDKTARFTNGVPAVSDADQSAWMLYVYKQFDRPANATGVPVTISVIDSNGNFRTIGTATSDSNGKFHLTWTPDIPGDFTVVATFAGSHAYYGSSDETFFNVAAPHPTAAPVATAAPTMADQYLLPSVAAIIVVIIIGFAVLALLPTTKRP